MLLQTYFQSTPVFSKRAVTFTKKELEVIFFLFIYFFYKKKISKNVKRSDVSTC